MPIDLWKLLRTLRRRAAQDESNYDHSGPRILRRAELYLARGRLHDPGLSTRDFDPHPQRPRR